MGLSKKVLNTPPIHWFIITRKWQSGGILHREKKNTHTQSQPDCDFSRTIKNHSRTTFSGEHQKTWRRTRCTLCIDWHHDLELFPLLRNNVSDLWGEQIWPGWRPDTCRRSCWRHLQHITDSNTLGDGSINIAMLLNKAPGLPPWIRLDQLEQKKAVSRDSLIDNQHDSEGDWGLFW